MFHIEDNINKDKINFKNRVRKADEYFISRWSSNLKSTSSDGKSGELRLYDVRNSMKKVLEDCDRIASCEKSMRDNITMPMDSFSANLDMIQNLKNSVNRELSALNAICPLLKKKLSLRRRKRLRLQRQRIEFRNIAKIIRTNNESKDEEIDKWLEKNKSDIIDKRKAEEAKMKADAVLKDVTKRKAEARKNISLLDHVCRLREAREKTAAGCGRRVDPSESKAFSESVDKLKALWNAALIEYEAEEQRLKETLHSEHERSTSGTCVENTDDNAERIKIDKWKEVLFGDANVTPQRNFNQNLYHFMSVRQQWDRWISAEGSRIPFGWIRPVPLSEKWKPHI